MRFKIAYYKKRFLKSSGSYPSILPEKIPQDSIKSVHMTALKLLGRAKFLFLSTLTEDRHNNAYACYVLVRAYFETCMALGFLTVKVVKNIERENWEDIWNTSHKIAQGGRHFPSDEYLAEKGKERVTAINVYDYIDEVDSDISKVVSKRGQKENLHREMYDSVLSEFGHPNHLGLQISSFLKDQKDGLKRGFVDLDRSNTYADRRNYLNYLDWGSLIFFHYWDKLVIVLKKFEILLPSLK